MLAVYGDLDLRQFLAQHVHRCRQPFRLATAQKPQRQCPLLRIGGAPSGGGSSLDLRQREPRMIEKRATGGGQLNPPSAAGHQLGADFRFQVQDLPA
jgi:hypothetical protein